MDSSKRRQVLLKNMATLCAVLILTITSISAYIRLSNAGLGCATWPQCYGRNLRQAQEGIAAQSHESVVTVGARMVHRVVAVAALLLIIIMSLTCFSAKPVLWHAGWLTLALLALSLLLALLGRWSGGARIPAVAIGNLIGGFAMLVLCWRLHRQLDARPSSPSVSILPGTAWWRVGVWISAAILLCEVALGGLVSTSYSGLSCTALPGCSGRIVEFEAEQATELILEAFNPWREPVFDLSSPANPAGAAPHMAHRYGALLASLLLLPLAYYARRIGRPRYAWILVSLLAAQVCLGLALVAFSLPLEIALAHNLFAALLLAAIFTYPLTRPIGPR
ncbi:MAG: COX15/CtaA family protein [Sterolibacterium sp.]